MNEFEEGFNKAIEKVVKYIENREFHLLENDQYLEANAMQILKRDIEEIFINYMDIDQNE